MEMVNTYRERPMDFKEWALNIFLASLPIIGFVLLLVWAFSSSENSQKQEWAKGRLLVAFLGFLFVMVILFFFGGLAFIGAAFDH